MAAEHAGVDLRRWPEDTLKAALGHLGADTTGCADSEGLADRLLRAPLRDVRAALVALGASTSDCVERADLLVRLLQFSQAAAAKEEEESEPWPPGSVVRLMKLQSAPALNMQRATIVRYDPAADRYEVCLHFDGSTKRVREENLILEEEAAAGEGEDSRASTTRGSPPEHHPSEAMQVSAEAMEPVAPSMEAEGPGDETDQAEAPPTACPAAPAPGDSRAGGEAPKEPLSGGVEASATTAASGEPGAEGPAAPEVRRRKRKFKDQPQPEAARAPAAPAAEGQRGPETPPAAVEAIAASSPAAASSPWVVRASAKATEEALVPLRGESTPARKPTRLRVGYKGLRQPEGAGRMANGLRALFWSGELFDVTLAVGDSSLRAHGAVLAGQSDVLLRLLKDSAEVRLPEVSHPEAVRLMLDYLYEVSDESGYSPATQGINSDVLRLADKFQLPELKRRAAVFMATGITTENAVERLQLCEHFKLYDLRVRILEQLAVNRRALTEISKSPAIARCPQLLQEILKRVASTGGPS